MKFYQRCAALLLALMSTTACASIIKGQSQSITITTPPTTEAMCVVSNAEGMWSLTSPGTITVQRSKLAAEVRCNKPGWQEGVGTIPSNFEGWAVGNVIAGGIIGLGVDVATGAINQYPNEFQVFMQQLRDAQAP